MSVKPWTWKSPESSDNIKRNVVRQDAFDKVSGQAEYTRDLSFPGMLYAKILTSPHAHAKIVSMDTSAAEELIGVRGILKYDDPEIIHEGGTGVDSAFNYSILTLPGTSDFFQHPMGVVVIADSEEICDRALRLIKVQWEERPFILDMEESSKPNAPKIMTDTWRIHPKAKEPNVVLTEETEIGNVKKAFAVRPITACSPHFLL